MHRPPPSQGMALIAATFFVPELLLPSAALSGANAALLGCVGAASLRTSALLLFLWVRGGR